MPNIKSAKKRVLVSAARYERNKSYRSALRTSMKKANAAIANHDENAEVLVKEAIKNIDMAVSKGILHKNTAAHKKSKFVVRMNKAAQ